MARFAALALVAMFGSVGCHGAESCRLRHEAERLERENAELRREVTRLIKQNQALHAALTADDEDDDEAEEADEIAVAEPMFGRAEKRHVRDLMDPFPVGDCAR